MEARSQSGRPSFTGWLQPLFLIIMGRNLKKIAYFIFQEEILVAINTLQRSPVYGHDTDFTALLGLFNCHSQNWSKMSFICPPTPVKFYCKKWYNISFSNLIFITRLWPSSIIMDLIFWFKREHKIFPRGYPQKFLRSYSGCFNGKVKYHFG